MLIANGFRRCCTNIEMLSYHYLYFCICPLSVELGMGIHGEPGDKSYRIDRSQAQNFARRLVFEMCSRIDGALCGKDGLTTTCTGLAIMVNNLGSVPQSEMLIVCHAVSEFLYHGNGRVMNGNLHHVRFFSGSFLTSLQMNGVSITCLALPMDNGYMERLLLAETECEAWSKGFALQPPSRRRTIPRFLSSKQADTKKSYGGEQDGTGEASSDSNSKYGLNSRTEKYITVITESLLAKCDYLGSLDRLTGDGDIGDTGKLHRGIQIISCGSYCSADTQLTNTSLLFADHAIMLEQFAKDVQGYMQI